MGDAAGDTFGNTYIINGSPSELKKLSPSGAVLWTQPNNINGNKVEVGTDNNPVVGGYPLVNYGAVIMKYDDAGNFLWQNLDADGAGLALLALAPMKLDANNNAYLAGSTMSQMGVCKVNSNGTSAWATTTSSGYPVWFVFGTDSCVYIVGGTTAKVCENTITTTAESLNRQFENLLEIYPNPTSDILKFKNLNLLQHIIKIEIFDATCKKILETYTSENNIDVSKLNQGIYFVRIQENDHILSSTFVVAR